MGDYAESWNDGRRSAAEVFGALAEQTGMSFGAVEAHARDCCTRPAFNPTAWRVATERRRPQALVTVNPDLFADWVVPTHDLAKVFEVIVMSFAERTTDKTALCDIALGRLGFQGDRQQVLLIDNRLDLVESWRAAGGSGYWFQNDGSFEKELAQLLR